MNWDELLEKTIGEIAAQCPDSWEILEAKGADICFCGYTSLEDWIEDEGLDEAAVKKELLECLQNEDSLVEYSPSLRVLTSKIVKEFHIPQKKQLNELLSLINTPTIVCAANPTYLKIKDYFNEFVADVLKHFACEESETFPELNQIDIFGTPELNPPKMQFGTVSGSLKHWEDEHMKVIEDVDKVVCEWVDLKNKYNDELVTTICQKLLAFVPALKRHVHFENYVLLPASMKVEQALSH